VGGLSLPCWYDQTELVPPFRVAQEIGMTSSSISPSDPTEPLSIPAQPGIHPSRANFIPPPPSSPAALPSFPIADTMRRSRRRARQQQGLASFCVSTACGPLAWRKLRRVGLGAAAICLATMSPVHGQSSSSPLVIPLDYKPMSDKLARQVHVHLS